MKRIHPLLLLIAFAVLLVGGIVWQIVSADECMDQGGTVVGPMTQGQHCAAQ